MLEIRQLSKRFGSTKAVDGISFQVRSGEIVDLLGPNGSGKTTTLKAITGLIRPTEGTVLIAGRPNQGAVRYDTRLPCLVGSWCW